MAAVAGILSQPKRRIALEEPAKEFPNLVVAQGPLNDLDIRIIDFFPNKEEVIKAKLAL